MSIKYQNLSPKPYFLIFPQTCFSYISVNGKSLLRVPQAKPWLLIFSIQIFPACRQLNLQILLKGFPLLTPFNVTTLPIPVCSQHCRQWPLHLEPDHDTPLPEPPASFPSSQVRATALTMPTKAPYAPSCLRSMSPSPRGLLRLLYLILNVHPHTYPPFCPYNISTTPILFSYLSLD